jgi:hypothetical protein
MDVGERQVASTTEVMVGTADRPTVFGRRISLRLFTSESFSEKFQIFWLALGWGVLVSLESPIIAGDTLRTESLFVV